jgi:hypothetical protein
MNKMKKYSFVLLLVLLIGVYFGLIKPARTRAITNFTNAYVELTNSRFSYRAGVGIGASATTNITIDSSSDTNKNGDINTSHLFPNDLVCFTPSVAVGCRDNKYYTVANIIDPDEFNVTDDLGTALTASDLVIASQAGQAKFYFTTVSDIPTGGSILLTIPAVKTAGKTNDSFPDTADVVANNGFDLNGIAAADVTVTGCTDANWNATETITPGNGSTENTISIARLAAPCAAGTPITVTIDSAPGLLNPAPVAGDTHSQGVSDVYNFNIKSKNADGDILDESDVKVSPVEGVLVTAIVDETLSFSVAGVTADTGTYCGVTRTASTPDTTATAITWGTTLPPAYAVATHNTQQKVSVTTNATSGFKVYIEENDQMGRNGNICTGDTPAADGYTFTAGTCIRDTVCGTSACTNAIANEWGVATPGDPSDYPGLGYSLQNDSGDTTAKFVYNSNTSPCTAVTGGSPHIFCAKRLPDVETIGSGNQFITDAEIMTSSAPVDDAGVYVCYRIDITGLQPSGYYYNKISYTAVPKF